MVFFFSVSVTISTIDKYGIMYLSMSEKQPELTPEQRMLTAERLIHDAQLLNEGAYITTLGAIGLSNPQLERAQRTGDPLRPKFELYDPHIQSWLETPVVEAFEPFKHPQGPTTNLAGNRMRQYGVHTLRDVYVRGKEGLEDISKIGELTRSRIFAVMEDAPYPVPLLVAPTARDIAQFCPDINQVKDFALHGFWLMRGQLTIPEILTKSAEELNQLYGYNIGAQYAGPRIRAEAFTFMEEFKTAQAEQQSA